MVLPFPVLADYAAVLLGAKKLYLSHGHVYSPDRLPPLCPGDVFLSGHTHIPMDEDRGGVRCLNPGSVSIPKAGSAHSALLYGEDGAVRFLDLANA